MVFFYNKICLTTLTVVSISVNRKHSSEDSAKIGGPQQRATKFPLLSPVSKFPCKHGVGLFLRLTEQADQFAKQEPPEWVATWLDRRLQRQAQPSAK
jgi:hypothetical protein